MAADGPLPAGKFASPIQWSLFAGLYALFCAGLLLLLLSQITDLIAAILGLPTESALWLAAPVPVIGAIVWWIVVERGGRYAYTFGGAAGLITGILTVSFWVLRGAMVWGVEGVLVGWPLIYAVVVPSLPFALLVGVPLMYVRRRQANVLL